MLLAVVAVFPYFVHVRRVKVNLFSNRKISVVRQLLFVFRWVWPHAQM